MTFIRRHLVPVLIGLFGLFGAFFLSWLCQDYQVGIGPEFIIKAFCKLFYVTFVWIVSHVIIKNWFSTVYNYCRTEGGTQQSEFMKSWFKYRETGSFDQRIAMAIFVHVGTMFTVAVIMALAF